MALKVLSPELALAVRTERFLREIQIAAQLTHAHILTLIDSGEAADCAHLLQPDWQAPRCYLAQVYLTTGRTREAVEEYQRLVALPTAATCCAVHVTGR